MKRSNSCIRLLLMSGLILGVLCLHSTPSKARTWQVTKQGNGDFLVIQDAVDAAAAGDTIMIAAGRYDEFTWIQLGGRLHYVTCYQSLTFIGAGAEVTKIGMEDPDFIAPNVNQEGIVCPSPGQVMWFKDIGFENMRHGRGIGLANGQLNVENCTFTHCSDGIVAIAPLGGVIRNCSFTDIGLWPEGTIGTAVLFSQPTNGVIVENCEFIDCFEGVGSFWDQTRNIEVVNCRIIGGRIGVSFVDRASGSIRNCYIEGQDKWGIAGSEAGTVIIEDNVIVVNFAGTRPAIGFGTFFTGGNFTLRRNVITASGGNKCLNLTLPSITLDARDNHFIRLDTESLYCDAYAKAGGPYFIDIRHNWWGTTDAQEISDGIIDLNDDPAHLYEYIFEPILDHPVSNEKKSFGDLKAMFR